MNKNIILENCNQLTIEQLIGYINSNFISLEEFIDAGLGEIFLKEIELTLCNNIDLDKLIFSIDYGKYTIEDLKNYSLAPEKIRLLHLHFCNSFDISYILSVIQSGELSITELEATGLNASRIKELNNALAPEIDKADFLADIHSKSALEIRKKINNNLITFDDLKGLVDNDIIDSLKHFYNISADEITYKIDDLPPMQEGRTDVFFVGMPGAGKSTMLAGVSLESNEMGIRFPDTYSINGTNYQDKLIHDLEKKVLPEGTLEGSYNYIPFSLKIDSNSNHPFNIVEVPGEHYVAMNRVGNSDEFLKYISKTKNKKILIFVLDSINRGKQSTVFLNIINMFKRNDILEKTDAVYIVVNKFDYIKEKDYKNDNRDEEAIAFDFLSLHYLGLLNNIKDARNNSNHKFKIKIFPFSIGSVCHGSILKNINNKNSRVLINHLMFDSFVKTNGIINNIF